MKAIPTGGVFLACFGTAIDQAVATALVDPDLADLATGYELADRRGAFTLSTTL
ncbi:MAG: hypothetical protein WBG92_06670 [Thiohalocapsa sp.]